IKTIVKGFSTKGTRGLGLSEIQAMTGKSPVVKNWFKKNGKVGGAKASIELETVPPPK
ncbi:MAG: hypothetical protein K0S20_198, partial [Patescibacteria group bacterium]|nr:hypothetical protein [Patescibacteria group bacterium]